MTAKEVLAHLIADAEPAHAEIAIRRFWERVGMGDDAITAGRFACEAVISFLGYPFDHETEGTPS